MSLIWPEDLPKSGGKRFRPNPIPRIPQTGWAMKNYFPDLSGAKVICLDLETKDPDIDNYGPGWGRGVGHIIGVAVATDDGFKNYYPIRHEGYKNHNPEEVLAWASEQFSRPQQAKLGHNILYDLGWLAHEGVRVEGDIHDTWTIEKLLDHSAPADLEHVGQRRVGAGKDTSILYDWCWQAWGQGNSKSKGALRKNAMKNLWRCPPELVGWYAESDVELPLQFCHQQFDELEAAGLWDVYRLECDLLPVLVQMRLAGVSVDLDAAERAHKHISEAAEVLQKEVNGIAGCVINTGSPVDMEKVFTRLKIPFIRTENEKMSLAGSFMKEVEHPIGQKIIDLQELKKYNSTFIENAILGSNVNGKIHGEFKPMTAVTGRMSAATPNLQQVPSRNDLAKMVRGIFIPDRGDVSLGKWDYSSVESRILGHYAVGDGAAALRKEYKRNPKTDYHDWTQKMIKRLVGLELPRKHVKNVNFAGIYGASQKKLQSMMGISNEEAEVFFEAYHRGLPYVSETMQFMSDYANEHGETRTILNRRAIFDHWEPKYTPFGKARPVTLRFNDAVRAYGPNIKRSHLHKALNYAIQGSAADLMKTAMVRCWKEGVFDSIGVPRMVIHDELVLSMKEGYKMSEFKEMQYIMENAIKFKVPILSEGEIGPNWANTERI